MTLVTDLAVSLLAFSGVIGLLYVYFRWREWYYDPNRWTPKNKYLEWYYKKLAEKR